MRCSSGHRDHVRLLGIKNRYAWSLLLQALFLLLCCSGAVGVQPRVTPACVPATKVDDLRSFGNLDLTQLTTDAKVSVCEARSPEAGGVLFVTNFINAEEVEVLSDVGLMQFPKSEDGMTPHSKTGYVQRFLRAGPDASFAQDHQQSGIGVAEPEKQRVMRRINARMDAITGSRWRDPYFQFILQNATGKTGTHWGDMRVHHERHHEETQRSDADYSPRYATVLIYLRNPPEGGHTLFPTLESGLIPSSETSGRMQSDVRAKIKGHMLQTTNPTIFSAEQQIGRVIVDHINHHQQDLRDSELSRPILGAMCDDVRAAEAAQAQSPFFAIRGEPGDAAVFWHWTSNMTSEWVEHWHGGCPALGGSKLAMQSYREASAFHWLKLHNRLGMDLVLQRLHADGQAETIGAVPRAAQGVHFEYLASPGETLQVVSTHGSYKRKIGPVTPADAGRSIVIELKASGQRSRIPPGLKRRTLEEEAARRPAKDEV